MNLTMDRFRQMVEVIGERKRREMEARRRWDLQVAEVVVKAHGSLLSGLAQNKKQASSISKAVQNMRIADLLDGEEEQQSKREDRVPTDKQVFAAFGLTASGLAGVK